MHSPLPSWARHWVLLTVAALVLLPLLATLFGGLKSLGELRAHPMALPQQWIWSNWWEILQGQRYWAQMGNSLQIALLSVGLTVVLASLAAFSLAFMKLRGANLLLGYIMLGLMFPLAASILPLFLRVRDLGLLDSAWGVVLPQAAFGLATAVLLLKNAFHALPRELLEAAVMDACPWWRCCWRIVLPLARPTLATVAVLSFVGSWNAYLLPLVVLNDDKAYPWPLGIMAYQGEYTSDWQLVLAFVTLTLLPAVLLFLLAQRHIVAGLTAGAVKS